MTDGELNNDTDKLWHYDGTMGRGTKWEQVFPMRGVVSDILDATNGKTLKHTVWTTVFWESLGKNHRGNNDLPAKKLAKIMGEGGVQGAHGDLEHPPVQEAKAGTAAAAPGTRGLAPQGGVCSTAASPVAKRAAANGASALAAERARAR